MKFAAARDKAVALFESPLFIQRIRDEDDTMIKHLPILQRINALGYITTESQAGRKTVSNDRGYTISERAYLTGFMKEQHAAKFIKSMGLYTDKNAAFVPVLGNNVYLPAALDVPLTVTSRTDGTVSVNTHASMALPKRVWEQFLKQAHLDASEHVVFVHCWDTHWNRPADGSSGLFTDVVKVLHS